MTTREELYQVLESLTEEQMREALEKIRPMVKEDPFAGLRGVAGIYVPEKWPPEYEKFEQVKVEGEPVSEQLIRERR